MEQKNDLVLICGLHGSGVVWTKSSRKHLFRNASVMVSAVPEQDDPTIEQRITLSRNASVVVLALPGQDEQQMTLHCLNKVDFIQTVPKP